VDDGGCGNGTQRRPFADLQGSLQCQGLPNNVRLPYMDEASMAKAYTGHAALDVVSESLQMFGAAGYSQSLPLERMFRDVRMFQIGGGTTQAQKNMIARSIFKKKFSLIKIGYRAIPFLDNLQFIFYQAYWIAKYGSQIPT
jgi:hypothetical protein